MDMLCINKSGYNCYFDCSYYKREAVIFFVSIKKGIYYKRNAVIKMMHLLDNSKTSSKSFVDLVQIKLISKVY